MKKSIVLLIFMVCIYAMLKFPYTMINPGELLEGHKKIKEDCASCHTFFNGISSDKCIACHKLSEIGSLSDSSSDRKEINKKNILFHQQLAGQECVSCHTDHLGSKTGTTIRSFSHESLTNVVKINCSGCHKSKQDTLHILLLQDCGQCHNTNGWSPANFNHNLLQGSKKNCLSCHRKPTDSYHNQLNSNCTQCHSTNKWIPSTFDHSKYFKLDNNHDAKCNTCHSNNDFSSYSCYGCHEHSQSKLADEHNEEGIYNYSNCISCHKSGNKHETGREGSSDEQLNQKDMKGIQNFLNKNEGKNKDKEHEDHKQKKEHDDD